MRKLRTILEVGALSIGIVESLRAKTVRSGTDRERVHHLLHVARRNLRSLPLLENCQIHRGVHLESAEADRAKRKRHRDSNDLAVTAVATEFAVA